MGDKIENKPVAEKQNDNTLSNLALDLMKGAMMGGIAGAALADKQTRDAVIAAGAGVVGGAAAAAAARRGAVEAGIAAGAGGAVGAGAAAVGKEIVKENAKEINKAGNIIKDEVNRQLKEIQDTPKDVMDHIKKRPVTALAETVIGGPLAPILDAKLRKWFGD